MRQQVPLTPGRKRLRALSSLLEAGRGPTCRQTTRARSGRPQLYTITLGWKGILFAPGSAGIPACVLSQNSQRVLA